MEAGDSAVEQEPNSDSNLALDHFTGAGSCDVQDVVRRSLQNSVVVCVQAVVRLRTYVQDDV